MSTKNSILSLFLQLLIGLGTVGAALCIFPALMPEDEALYSLSTIGDTIAVIVEIIILSLVANKIHKDNISKPSYILIGTYAVLLGVALIISFKSEEIGIIADIINIVLAIVVGFFFLAGEDTKKIGLWLLLSLVGAVLLMVFADPEITDKYIQILLAALYVCPFYYYLRSGFQFIFKEEQ